MLDTGRVTLVMRARQTDGVRFPFLKSDRRRYAVGALAAALAIAAIAGLLLVTVR